MNASCQSSIHDYESGSVWLKELHEIASGIDGVYGNRFSGGGYGGCLFMLVNKKHTAAIAKQVIDEYLTRYPDKQGLAFVNIAQSESTVRVVQL